MKIKKFQDGGAVAPEQAAQGAAPEQNPIEQLGQMAMEATQSKNCELAMQVCAGFLQLVQQSQGGQEAPQGTPMQKCGGKIKIKKKIVKK